MIDYLYLLLYKAFAFFIKILPGKWLDTSILALARFAYFASAKRRNIIQANLKVCFPNMSEEERKSMGIYSYQNLLHNIASFIKSEGKTKEEILQNIRFENREIADEILKTNQKVIFMTAHMGLWEVLAPAVSLGFNIPFAVVGRELDSPLMQQYLKKGREQLGVELINKRGALKGMIKAIGQGKFLGLLIDQSVPKNLSIDVKFFNKTVTQTSSISLLAHKFDAVIIPIFIHSEDFKQHTVTCYSPITVDKSVDKKEDIKRLNQAQADVVQNVIQKYPQEWFWSHKRFKVYNKEIYNAQQ